MSEAEKSLAELQALLESRDPSTEALARASQRVQRALSRLSRATAPDELARIVDLHAVVRGSVGAQREALAADLARVADGRARLARLTRPEEGAGGLDVNA